MAVSNDVYLPSYEELTVPQEIEISWPVLKAASFHMGAACDEVSKEYMLCRAEEQDPRKCLREAAEVTACGVKFLQKVKASCRQEFEQYADCIDHKTAELYFAPCRRLQRVFDICAKEKLGVDRPPLGHFARPRLHESTRRPAPPPTPQELRWKKYQEEADKVVAQLPEDWPMDKPTRPYYHWQPLMDFFITNG